MEIDRLRPRETSAREDSAVPEARRDPDAQPHIVHAHEQLLDGSARLYAQNATRSNVNGAAPSFNDQILYVGMNTTVASGQAQNVREATNLGASGVTKIRHGMDHLGADLATDGGRKAFVASLGLPQTQATKVESLLATASPGSREELAEIAQVWARAEHGQSIPSRLVLSGHSAGTSVYDGVSHDALTFDSVQKLADAMPRAAAQIEDAMVSACYSGFDDGSRTRLSSWKDHFPNLKTAWGYSADDSHSPTEAHAVSHIAAWRAATAGRATHIDGARAVRVEYARENYASFAAENVAIWSEADGYRRGH